MFPCCVCCVIKANAQNLIKNPNFEQLKGNCIPFNSSLMSFGLLNGNSCQIANWYAVNNIPYGHSTKTYPGFGNYLPNGYYLTKYIFPHSDSICVSGTQYLPYNSISGGGGVNFREFIEGELIKPLINGHHYAFSIWIRSADTIVCGVQDRGVLIGINSFSALFSDTFFNYTDSLKLSRYKPQVQINTMVTDTGSWVELKDTFLCEGGGENYIIFGNFKQDGQFQYQLIDSICNKPLGSYNFYDDVSLIDLDAVGVNPVDLSAIDDFALYPNPTDKELKIAAKNLPNGSTLQIMNYAGILIHSI